MAVSARGRSAFADLWASASRAHCHRCLGCEVVAAETAGGHEGLKAISARGRSAFAHFRAVA